jgi:hypothetical protein
VADRLVRTPVAGKIKKLDQVRDVLRLKPIPGVREGILFHSRFYALRICGCKSAQFSGETSCAR